MHTYGFSTEEHPITRLMNWVSRIGQKDIERVQSINHVACGTSERTTPEEEARICQMANAGVTIHAIARETNRDKSTIRRVLAEEGVDMRHLTERRNNNDTGTAEIGRRILAEIKNTGGNIVTTPRKMGYTSRVAFESIALAGGVPLQYRGNYGLNASRRKRKAKA